MESPPNFHEVLSLFQTNQLVVSLLDITCVRIKSSYGMVYTVTTHTLTLMPLYFPGQPPDLDDACYDKVALLIGNKHYQRANLKLNTPENDTQDMAGVLLSAGFKVVSLVNLNKIEMEMVRGVAVGVVEGVIGRLSECVSGKGWNSG